MADTLTPERRSRNMARIRSKDTAPEMAVRRMVWAMGYRYRLHAKELPGKPDLVFRPRRKAIFVHGCFWHQHRGCREGRVPGSNLDYWPEKLRNNVRRDERNLRRLRRAGWKVLVLWECQVRRQAVQARIARFLADPA